jgi:serine/threonine-protein kinase
MVCPVNRSRGATWTSDDRIVIAPGGNSGLQIVAASGGTPKDLTTLDTAKKEATHRWPQALPGDKFVLFTSHIQATGTFDQATIEVVELATGNRKVVYRGGSYGRYVPSGHLIYANSGTLFAVPFDLGRMEVTGTPVPVVQDVTSSPAEGAAQFAFSDTGLLGYLRGGVLVPEYPIVRVDRSGAVSALLDQPGAYASPRFSPDGRRLALTVLKEGNFDVWVYDLERHVLTRLTFSEDTDTEQIWSPDGSELAFGSNRGHKATTLFRKPSDGSGEEQVIAPTDVDVWPTSWSPDGKHIAFSASRKTFDVGVVALGAKPEYQWPVATGFVEIDPAFSPDGRWIAYTSNESGQSQIYVRPFPSGTGRWQISDSPGGYPRWSRDGRELFYRSDGGIMVAAIEPTGAGLRTGKPQLLFKGNFRGGAAGLSLASNVFADYDVAPDGRSFVMFPSGAGDHGDRAGLVTLVTNWFDELKRVSAR